MEIILLTGGIGCGKSVVAHVLRSRKEPVYDCDSEAKRLMDSDPELKSRLKSKFGEKCIDPKGRIDRKEVADRVFSDREALAWLNNEVHSMVREDIGKRIKELTRQGTQRLFIETAIPKASGLTELADAIWMVTAPIETRLQRVCNRDNCKREAILKRIEAQQKEFDDFGRVPLKIIINDGRPLLPQLNK